MLIDGSGSTAEKFVREKYLKEDESIIEGLKGGDRIIFAVINSGPLTQPEILVDEEIPKFSFFGDSEILYKGKVKKLKKQILERLNAHLAGFDKPAKESRIMDALLMAEQFFYGQPEAEKVLILQTDGIEEGARLNLLKENLTEERITKIVQMGKVGGKLPRLAGVRVYFCGAGVGSYRKLSTEKVLSIRNFWLKFFEECSVDFSIERFSSQLPDLSR